jgi:aminomethyltransferase
MVNLDKESFIGKEALQTSETRRRIWGLRVPGGVARLGDGLARDGSPAGRVCSTAWSPFQQCGVAIVRMEDARLGPGTALDVDCRDGVARSAEVCDLPMYDQDREIPRGKRVDIPERPTN